MMDYIKKILDGNSPDASSKRFTGLVALGVAILLAGIALIPSVDPDTHYFDGFLMFAAGAFAISGIEKFASKKKDDAPK